jgi:hypothetical protein
MRALVASPDSGGLDQAPLRGLPLWGFTSARQAREAVLSPLWVDDFLRIRAFLTAESAVRNAVSPDSLPGRRPVPGPSAELGLAGMLARRGSHLGPHTKLGR